MKKLLIGSIKFYQIIPGPWHAFCRHFPSCSNYALQAIEEHGTLKGSYLTVRRLLRCTPWGTPGYDPVLKKETA